MFSDGIHSAVQNRSPERVPLGFAFHNHESKKALFALMLWAPSTPHHHCCSCGSPAEFDCCCREKKQRPGGRTGWRPTLVKSIKRSETTQMATFWTASEYIGEGILLQRGSAYSYVPTSLVSNLREPATHGDRCTLGENDLPLRFPLPHPALGYSAARNYRPAAERWVSEGMKAVIQPEPEVGHFPRSGPYLLRLGKKKEKRGKGSRIFPYITVGVCLAIQIKKDNTKGTSASRHVRG